MLETAIAVVALFWTIFQQYQINKMCSACEIRKNYYMKHFGEEEKIK